MKTPLFLGLLLLAGCGTAPTTMEGQREIVLQYVGVDVGTAGPFSRKTMHDLDVLSVKDRSAAAALLDRGAVAFLVFPKTSGATTSPAAPATASSPSRTRVILLDHGRIVADFQSP